ncbi:hypothetical protein C8Q77DRAFT_460598 [Trametes polyzona]|nr:hypothetical protein C8Q77DRAFT_460598 [Trametes polyzona]
MVQTATAKTDGDPPTQTSTDRALQRGVAHFGCDAALSTSHCWWIVVPELPLYPDHLCVNDSMECSDGMSGSADIRVIVYKPWCLRRREATVLRRFFSRHLLRSSSPAQHAFRQARYRRRARHPLRRDQRSGVPGLRVPRLPRISWAACRHHYYHHHHAVQPPDDHVYLDQRHPMPDRVHDHGDVRADFHVHRHGPRDGDGYAGPEARAAPPARHRRPRRHHHHRNNDHRDLDGDLDRDAHDDLNLDEHDEHDAHAHLHRARDGDGHEHEHDHPHLDVAHDLDCARYAHAHHHELHDRHRYGHDHPDQHGRRDDGEPQRDAYACHRDWCLSQSTG